MSSKVAKAMNQLAKEKIRRAATGIDTNLEPLLREFLGEQGGET